MPIINGRLRPYLSVSGPQITELTLMKTKNNTSDKLTRETEQLSCSLIEGNAGRYKSVDNAGKDAKRAKNGNIKKSGSCFESALDGLFITY